MSLAQTLADNPSWPAIPGQGRFAGLPPELQPVFKKMEDNVYAGSISWWINLVVLGIIGWDFLTSLPSDIKMVWWPEVQRCLLGRSSGTSGAAFRGDSDPSNSNSAGDRDVAMEGVYPKQARRPFSSWRLPRPIIACHLIARLLVFPYFAVVINYYRLPQSCDAALHSSLFVIGLCTVNGQSIMTLRCGAITRTMPQRYILMTALWLINVALLVIWTIFAFTASIPQSYAAALPMGFRVGFRCGPAVIIKWGGIAAYALSGVEDLTIFTVSVMSVSKALTIDPVVRSRRGSNIASFFRTLWTGLRAALLRAVVGEDTFEGSSSAVVSTQFIIDSIRALASCLLLEAVGIGLNCAFMFAHSTPDTTRTSWVLPLHAIISLVVCPRVVSNSRALAYHVGGARNGGTYGRNENSGNVFGGDQRKKSGALQGVSILSTVQQHTEKVEDTDFAYPLPLRGSQQQEAFRSYRPPVVLENVHTVSPSSTDTGGAVAGNPSNKYTKSDDDDASFMPESALSTAVPTGGHQYLGESNLSAPHGDYPPRRAEMTTPSTEELGFHAHMV